MTFSEAAMIMMSGSSPPVINPITITENGHYEAPEGINGYNPIDVNVPLTLLTIDSIRALKNMATITVGEYVWECKMPITISGGSVGINDIRFYHVMPFVINDEYAILGTYNDAYPDTYTWKEIDGIERYFKTTYSNHRVSGVGYTKQSSYSFINPKISYSLYGAKHYSHDEVADQPYEVYMGDVTMNFNTTFFKTTNMTPKEQFEFVKSYIDSEAYNEPVINII